MSLQHTTFHFDDYPEYGDLMAGVEQAIGYAYGREIKMGHDAQGKALFTVVDVTKTPLFTFDITVVQ